MEKESYEIDALEQKDEEMDAYKGEEPTAVRRKRELKQVGLVSLVGLSYFSLGAMLPWPSPALSDMAENNATLVGTEIFLTSAEKDMTGSLVYLGTLFGAWVAGFLVSAVGRRRSLQLIVAPLCGGLAHQRPRPQPPCAAHWKVHPGSRGRHDHHRRLRLRGGAGGRPPARHHGHHPHHGHRAGRPVHGVPRLRAGVARPRLRLHPAAAATSRRLLLPAGVAVLPRGQGASPAGTRHPAEPARGLRRRGGRGGRPGAAEPRGRRRGRLAGPAEGGRAQAHRRRRHPVRPHATVRQLRVHDLHGARPAGDGGAVGPRRHHGHRGGAQSGRDARRHPAHGPRRPQELPHRLARRQRRLPPHPRHLRPPGRGRRAG
ncbi:translation initiation factor IF-2-like isoform X1 [Penaeus monodon]|uniref:translation initiation factor IF-2-like isoform X1 n=1 Tax=Penaeus monodon TaxID=6687 RepID=UPI0018A6DEBD|nr:translation initiation factor IF-2-like isoform X1 [Penaeus monodon]XP_037780839.1 translation initiation factor IF-2-like isoform X1 [Penaeus monodon]